MITAVRGATTVEMNDKEMIYEASAEMMKEIIERNNIDKDDIVSKMCIRDRLFRTVGSAVSLNREKRNRYI